MQEKNNNQKLAIFSQEEKGSQVISLKEHVFLSCMFTNVPNLHDLDCFGSFYKQLFLM